MDRLTHVEQLLRNDPRDPVLAADYFVFQTLGQRPRDFIAQRGHEMNPVRTQARGEDGNHNDSAAPMSKTPPMDSGADKTPARYVSTFSTAMGWQRVVTHFGVTMTGKRWTR